MHMTRIAVAIITLSLIEGVTLSVVGAAPPVPAAPAGHIPPSWAGPAETVVKPPSSASLSPDALRAAWVSDDRRHLLSATRSAPTSDWTAPDRLLSTRGRIGKIVFSPDGRRIAYEDQRTWLDDGTASDKWQFIAVYDLASQRIEYVDPAFDLDTDPRWSQDGLSITFARGVDGLLSSEVTRLVPAFSTVTWQPPPRLPSERFTMAAIIATPYIEPPAPAGDGLSIAYLTREAENRNVYFLRVGEKARRLVNYPDDDGRNLSAVALSHGGGAVAYVRGERVNRHGDSPNPRAVR